jgi:integrase
MLSSQQIKSSLISTSVLSYLDHFIANAKFRSVSGGRIGLSTRAIANYSNFRIVFIAFEDFFSGTIYFEDLNKKIVDLFKKWLLEDRAYSDNHAGRLMGTLKTICVDAKKNDLDVHPYINYVSGFAQARQNKLINILSFSDLKKITSATIDSERLENVRKWMIIGFWLGQRVSDLLVLTKLDIRAAVNGGVYVDIIQKKTKTALTVGVINPLAVHIIKHAFPRRISDRCFNRYMKELLEIAGVNEEVKGYQYNPETKRKEIGLFPKYEVISSHDLRRSFATNFFGKIETPILMNMTGHSRESTFLSYIGRNNNRDAYADIFMSGVLKIQDTQSFKQGYAQAVDL